MNERFWDKIASRFDEEIFDTLRNDLKKTIINHIERYSSEKALACDFGCGVGRYLPVLSSRFKTVYAVDISNECLELAQKNCHYLKNIIYLRADMSDPRYKMKQVQFAVSINMLIMPSFQERMVILRNIYKHLAMNGSLLLVIPSLESILYSISRLLEWNNRSGSKHDSDFAVNLSANKCHEQAILEGIINLDGVETKHYLKEEISILLRRGGFQGVTISKVEYPWIVMFNSPPAWMKAPYPWDWLVICHKS